MKFAQYSIGTALAIALSAAPVYAQLSGAIFTTDGTGNTVNGNNYAHKADVYLNGGPQNGNCSAAGLPPGAYYFQVTDPSGATLLSTDAVANRIVSVAGGLIVGTTGNHALGSGKCGSVSIQLLPFADTPNPGCVYKVWMSTDPNFINSSTKTDNFRVCESDPTPPQGAISALKFYDANLNGTKDASDSPIAGWQVDSDSPIARACTDATGVAAFAPVATGITYNLTEIAPPPGFVPNAGAVWIPTTPTTGQTSDGGSPVQFGNVCVGAGGGLTLGFWSNKNGQNLEVAADFTTLTSLNLVNGDGSVRDFTAALSTNKSALSSWLLNATATNMAYMLSAQLAAMQLNVNHNLVSSSANVYAGVFPAACTSLSLALTPASQLGFITIGSLLTDANTLLASYPNTTAAGNARTCEEYVKTALDRANNNLNFVQPGPSSCPLPACPYAQ